MTKNQSKWPLFRQWKKDFRKKHPEILALPSDKRKHIYTQALRGQGIPTKTT